MAQLESIQTNDDDAESTPVASTSSNSKDKPFNIPLVEILCKTNFLTWRHFATFSICGQELEDHLDQGKISPHYDNPADEANKKESKKCITWRIDDYNVTSWLFTSTDDSFKHRVIGCHFTHEIWSRIHTKARARQLQLQLRSVKKQASTSYYLLQIKRLSDSLAAIGLPLSDEEYTNVILDGLSKEYHSFITMNTVKDPPYSILNLEALLMAQEKIIDRFKKSESSMVQVNLSQTTNIQESTSHQQQTPPTNSYSNPACGTYNNFGRAPFGRRGHGDRNSYGGRGSWGTNNRPQCQIYGKMGHVASYCYFSFDQNYSHAQNHTLNSFIHTALPPPPSFHNPKAMLATPSAIADQS
ncbi:uncharacterized protein [Arachis hypogaea]|uniref:uncharacterized protein n=1 Tax=Arachis hypogaea TaxID=3818 RepID=UPI0010FC4C89|nr:uncharacterized protein LOC114927582 [Arachis hypogaea]